MNYSEEIKKKFEATNFSIPYIPTCYEVKETKRKIKEIKFSSIEQYEAFLTKEKTFWEQYKGNSFFTKYISAYDIALNNLNYMRQVNNVFYFDKYLKGSKDSISKVPNSMSILTRELLKYKDKPEKFLEGFIAGVSSEDQSFSSTSKNYQLGLYKAFHYIEIIKKIDDMLPDQQKCFEETQIEFINTADEYIEKYNQLYIEKEKQFQKLDDNISKQLEIQKEEHTKFLEEKNLNIDNLEKLYAENLRLKKPAEYWHNMSEEYLKKGKKYLISSFVLAVISIAILSCLIIFVPATMEAKHWFDLIKNSAILTVIITILVYVMRIVVKMAMSSFHLSRDAREREQLTYFYLSLINEKAVTEKERELVITSLFSRSETGLLKGESSPEMPKINIQELINKK